MFYTNICETCGGSYSLLSGVYLNYRWRCSRACHKHNQQQPKSWSANTVSVPWQYHTLPTTVRGAISPAKNWTTNGVNTWMLKATCVTLIWFSLNSTPWWTRPWPRKFNATTARRNMTPSSLLAVGRTVQLLVPTSQWVVACDQCRGAFDTRRLTPYRSNIFLFCSEKCRAIHLRFYCDRRD